MHCTNCTPPGNIGTRHKYRKISYLGAFLLREGGAMGLNRLLSVFLFQQQTVRYTSTFRLLLRHPYVIGSAYRSETPWARATAICPSRS
ncbi:hypothetical protein BVI2075_960022 [Burkholderia vietnamiensis]|nr:hypothetical protein BVI2075_960022 [Burkholderia vietnamiensis]